MNIEKKLNEYLKNYDFGYDINLLDYSEWTFDNSQIGITIAHSKLSLEFIETKSSMSHNGDIYIKINNVTKEIIDCHVKIRNNI